MVLIIEKVIFDVVLLVLSACALIAAYNIPEGTGAISAEFFPKSVLWLGAFLMIIVVVQDIAHHKRYKVRNNDEITGKNKYRSIVCLLLVAAELVIYIAVFDFINFILSTSIFLFIGFMTCGIMLSKPNDDRVMNRYKAIVSALFLALGVACASYALFTQIFELSLP